MNLAPDSDLRSWSPSRWGGFVLLIFGLQLGLIYWLSDRTPVSPRALAPIPVLRPLSEASAESLALSDPTWFTLPHRQGFSGLAWLKVPEPEFHPLTWTSAPAWLELPARPTGAALSAFVRAHEFGSDLPAAAPELVLTMPEPEPVPLARQSTELHLEGDLAHRALLTPFEPKSQAWGDLLTNSVVQAVVDARGWAQTATLLWKSGSPEADREAVSFARRARFAPLADGPGKSKSPQASLTAGLLVFAWHTVPTNGAVSRTH